MSSRRFLPALLFAAAVAVLAGPSPAGASTGGSVGAPSGAVNDMTVEDTITVTGAPDPTTTTTDPPNGPPVDVDDAVEAPEITTTTTEPATPTSAGETAGPALPTDPNVTGSGADVDPTVTTAVTDEPTGAVSAAGATSATSDPAATTTTLPGTLPATGLAPIALGLGAVLVAAGSVVTALGTIATHGARRAGRGHRTRHR